MQTKGSNLWVFLTVAVVAVWAGGAFLHDSWLRPWPQVILFCGGATIVCVATACFIKVRWFWAALVMGCLAAMIMLALPLNSMRLAVHFRNATGSPVSVRVTKVNGQGLKQARIPPGGQWGFVFFAGDVSPGTDKIIAVRVEVKSLSSGSTGQRQIELPLTKGDQSIEISEDWFRISSKP